jgi:hypothetical protein
MDTTGGDSTGFGMQDNELYGGASRSSKPNFAPAQDQMAGFHLFVAFSMRRES